MSLHPAGFMSYVRTDDAHENGRISDLRQRLEGEIRLQAGDNTFHIFQDRKDIAWGQQWEQRINESLDVVTFLFPVITPGFFKSTSCRKELERFFDRERQLKRGDLILPIYYVDTPVLNGDAKRQDDKLATIIAERQYSDWRDLRFERLDSPRVGQMLATLAKQVVGAIERPTEGTAVEEPRPDDAPNAKKRTQHADQRLNEIIDFGSSLQEIATKFKSRMDEFNAIDGSGPDKFLDLAAHVYSCCARSLDIYLGNSSTTSENHVFAKDASIRLKRLADYGPDYLENNPFPKYWVDGTEIADELIAHARHSERYA